MYNKHIRLKVIRKEVITMTNEQLMKINEVVDNADFNKGITVYLNKGDDFDFCRFRYNSMLKTYTAITDKLEDVDSVDKLKEMLRKTLESIVNYDTIYVISDFKTIATIYNNKK